MLICMQITKFACGGISIGLGGSHALFDGVGAFNFLTTWANISSGKDESNLIVPNHSRHALLQAISCFSNSNPRPSYSSIYEQGHVDAIKDLYGIPMQSMAFDDKSWETALAELSRNNPWNGHVVLVTLQVKKEVVGTWKGLATQKGKLTKCSTFDILCAHLWKVHIFDL